jgi:hypothetical protein
MNPNIEWIPVVHSVCGGQGCRHCNQGEEIVRINHEEHTR